MYVLLLSTLPQTREARAHYDAFLSLKHEPRGQFAALTYTLDRIAALLKTRRAV